MKKKLVLVLVMGMVCASLAACGHKKKEESQELDYGKMKRVESAAESDVAVGEYSEEDESADVIADADVTTDDEIAEDGDAETYSVELTEVGPNKVKVIKTVRELTGCGLKEAKDLVDYASDEPVIVVESVSEEEAQSAITALEENEAKATLINED